MGAVKDYVSTLEMSESEWLEFRRTYIGASEVPVLAGVTPRSWEDATPYNIWRAKVEGWRNEALDENVRVQHGTYFEDYVAERYAMDHAGFRIERDNKVRFMAGVPFIGCNLDRRIIPLNEVESQELGGWGPAEIKCVSSRAKKYYWVDPETDQVRPPEWVTIQFQSQLLVTGRRWGIIIAWWNDECRYDAFFVWRDEELCQRLYDLVNTFWKNFVETKTPPPPITDSEVKARFRKATAGKIDASTVVTNAISTLALLKKTIKNYEEEKKVLEAGIKAFMGEHEILIDPEMEKPLATWKNNKSSWVFKEKEFQGAHPDIYKLYEKSQTQYYLDTLALAAAHPDIFKKFQEEVPGDRVFRPINK